MTSLALAVPLTVVSVLGLLLNVYILFVVLVTKQVSSSELLDCRNATAKAPVYEP